MITRKHIKRAIDNTNNSAAGPDGIPFMAWRKLQPLATHVLLDVTTALTQDNFQATLHQAYHDTADTHPHHYNYSTMACLPKKSHASTSDNIPAFYPCNTRPLNIVNTDNRIVASSARHAWEAHFAAWVLPRQQGFLRGRSILQNLFDIDTASMHTALMQDRGACILFDFASAFPSVSQDYLLKNLTSIGAPPNAINLISALYDNSYCRIQLNGEVGDPFSLKAGVRQGCPLSPIIYAVVAELLLDNIEHNCPHTAVRAYADDTAIVVEDIWDEGPTIARLFAEFQAISGLALNLHKCNLIPLFPYDHSSTQQQLHRTIPAWHNMQITEKGKYLGFWIGPGKGDASWQGPTSKYLSRCRLWQDRPLGLYFHTAVYNTLAITTLAYVAQLEHPPQYTLEAERQGLHAITKGPGGVGPTGWATTTDLWRLKEDFAQQHSFRSLPWLTEASQARVYMTDPACTSPTFRNNLQLLQAAMSRPNNLTTLSIWQDWFNRSFAISVYNTYHDIKAALGDNMPTTLSQHQRTRGCPSQNPDDGARRNKNLASSEK